MVHVTEYGQIYRIRATSRGNTKYLDQALQQPNCQEFLRAMGEEVVTHEKRGFWRVIPMAD